MTWALGHGSRLQHRAAPLRQARPDRRLDLHVLSHVGDFILPSIFGQSQLFLGQEVLQVGDRQYLLAAAFTFVAMAIMVGYLLVSRRTGAFETP